MRFILKHSQIVLLCLLLPALAFAQGVTTAALNGTVMDNKGQPIPGVNIIAVHTLSGTIFGAVSRADGRFNVPGIRVGGPYTVTARHVGYKEQKQENVHLSLGQNAKIAFVIAEEAVELGETVVVAERDAILSASRTGAATSVSSQAIASLPTISRRIGDFTRLTPQASGNTFAGQDNRLNNITVDGSYFNNSFGLAGQPGERTGVAPISIDAIEQVQVNIAPYDVRQGNFVGAGVNTVTKSGTNEFSGSLYTLYRNEDLVGTEAKDLKFNPGTFKYNQVGVRLGGPIIKNKLFFFADYEGDKLTQPGTTFTANAGGQTVTGSVTRVLASDLNRLSSFLKDSLGYETGSYQGYDFETPAKRFLAKLDYNLSARSKLSLRYTHLNSDTDVLLSNSSSLGFGIRRTVSTGLNFQNSNYVILENIRSIVGEWNSTIGSNMANNLIVGYTYNDESRESRGEFFPFVDILEAGSVYTSFGFEPFTPNNELRYKSFQLQNNFSLFTANHNLTFGASAERYESENVFFPGSQSIYTYNSLADFYRDARGYIANPNRTTSPVTLRRFQVRYNNIPGQEKPVQPLEVFYTGAYAQDEWQVNKNLRLTAGLRLDVPFFGKTGFTNSAADALSFRDETGATVKYSTGKLPDANILFSPRIGFNLDLQGDRSTQVRGGTGVFTARPAYVWISNQIGNTGVLTGFEELNNTTARPFNPDPDRYKPTNVTGAPASSYELALTDPSFKFPQLWRSNIAVDQKLPWGFIGTAEFLYNRDVNGIYYINANLAPPNRKFIGFGPDSLSGDIRPRWTTSNRINANVANAVVLKNQNEGKSWNIAASVEKPFSNDLFVKAAYSYGEAKNTVDPGSIAFGSWNNNQHAGDPNNPGLGFSSSSPGHRVFAALSYRREYFNLGGTTVSLFFEGSSFGNLSYTYSGDLNGDGGTSNDLIYIPRDVSEMNFQQYSVTVSGVTTTFSPQQQADAWNAYIQQDEYLSANRGKYAERNAVFLPMVYRADLSIAQDLFTNIANRRNTLQFRVDFLNVGNLINKNWGVAERFVNAQPLIVPTAAQGGAADTQGRARYRLRSIGNQLMSKSLEQSLVITDVFRFQIGLRYNFN